MCNLLFLTLSAAYFASTAASSCDSTIPGFWTGRRGGTSFGDVYRLAWSSSGPASGAWEVTLISGPNDLWRFGSGQFSVPTFAAVSVSFNTGTNETGAVSAACDVISWSDKTEWIPRPPPPPPPPQPAACSAVFAPAPCGQASDSVDRCLSKGCCYNAAFALSPCFYPGGDGVPLTHVHVIQASHFDAGFAYTIKDVLTLWCTFRREPHPCAPQTKKTHPNPTPPKPYNQIGYTHFPRALELGLQIDADPALGVGLRFTAQMWIIEMFFNCPPGVPGLRCPAPGEVANVTTSITRGFLTWHAFPFNSEAEAHTAGAFALGVGMAHALDDKFGFPRKATMSQRDVPGTTRAVVPALAALNVTAFSIGVNGASTPPFVPRAFVWSDAESGASMPMFVHPYGYGDYSFEGAVILPGLSHAMVFAWRGDNQGPPASVSEIVNDFASIRKSLSLGPGVAVFSSTFDNFTSHVVGNAAVLAALPVVTSELADTWMHGAASEPVRGAFFRRAAALLEQCVEHGACAPGDRATANFTRFLLKCGEHTWGKDIKSFLKDTVNWTNEQLQRQLAAKAPNFVDVVASWQEQRDWCATYAIQALQVASHPLAGPVADAYADLFPPASPPDPAGTGFAPFAAGARYTGSPSWDLSFDAATGALSLLVEKPSGRVWANKTADGSALLWAHYTALSADDYNTFTGPEPNGYYPLPGDSPGWYKMDFGKPNVSSANPVHSETAAGLVGLWLKEDSAAATFLVHSDFGSNPALHSYYGAPASVWLQLTVPKALPAAATITGALSIYGKTPTRLPEGLYLRTNASAGAGWRVGKLSSMVDPFDVVPGGNHHQHGFNKEVRAMAGDGSGAALSIASLDFSQAQLGKPIPLPAPVWANATSASEGLSFLLIDNTWGVRAAAAA
jgi:hypothetical protein